MDPFKKAIDVALHAAQLQEVARRFVGIKRLRYIGRTGNGVSGHMFNSGEELDLICFYAKGMQAELRTEKGLHLFVDCMTLDRWFQPIEDTVEN